MIGILVLLAVSWLLLHFIEKKSILALGILPHSGLIMQCLNGFLLTAALCGLVQLLESLLLSSSWKYNGELSLTTVFQSAWWDFRSVLTEELVFRGALLYILVQKIGCRRAILISAVAFGVYHWFSFGVFGNILAMILIFIGTGLMGYAWAWAFAKSKSILLPLALHFGWNLVHNTLFSNGPLGPMLFTQNGGGEITDFIALLNFLAGMVLAPIVLVWYVKFRVKEAPEHGLS